MNNFKHKNSYKSGYVTKQTVFRKNYHNNARFNNSKNHIYAYNSSKNSKKNKKHKHKNKRYKKYIENSTYTKGDANFLKNHPKLTRNTNLNIKTNKILRNSNSITHKILYQNIRGKVEERCINNVLWTNFINIHNFNNIQLVESKLSKTKLQKLPKISKFKAIGYPTQKIKSRPTSNGMISFINKSDCGIINNYYESMENHFIMKHIINKYKLITISVYIPPYESENQYFTEPERMEIIDTIYKNLSSLITLAKMINFRIIIIGDFNARIGNIIGDHNTNVMEINKFLPFI